MLKFILAVLLVVIGTVAVAEVIELEGTVKTIDTDARSIAITRQTPKGEKVLELEIAKNAGDVSGLKAGDRISFAYNPDAEIVTKIEKGLSEEATAALKQLQGVWPAIKIDHHGTMMPVEKLREQSRRIIIEGNTLTFEETNKEGKVLRYGGKITVDPEKQSIDLIGKGPMGAPFNLLAIYDVKGDELRFCYRRNGDGKAKRPVEFKADDERENVSMCYTCKRLPIE